MWLYWLTLLDYGSQIKYSWNPLNIMAIWYQGVTGGSSIGPIMPRSSRTADIIFYSLHPQSLILDSSSSSVINFNLEWPPDRIKIWGWKIRIFNNRFGRISGSVDINYFAHKSILMRLNIKAGGKFFDIYFEYIKFWIFFQLQIVILKVSLHPKLLLFLQWTNYHSLKCNFYL